MTASTLARFRCSLSGVQATDCVRVNYTVARQGVNGSACMRAIQFFDVPEWEAAEICPSHPQECIDPASVLAMTGLQELRRIP